MKRKLRTEASGGNSLYNFVPIRTKRKPRTHIEENHCAIFVPPGTKRKPRA